MKPFFKAFSLTLLIATLPLYEARGQNVTGVWNLTSCLEYARNQNLQVKKAKVSLQGGEVSLGEAKAAKIPTLSFSSGQSLNVQKQTTSNNGITSANSYNGSYSLNSAVDLYNGNRIQLAIAREALNNQSLQLAVEEALNTIEISVTQAFIQILYANESVEIQKKNRESSLAQLERAKVLFQAGSLSSGDLAQLQAQYSSDNYQVISSEATLSENRLALKQLLELGIEDEMQLQLPEVDSTEILRPLIAKERVYQTALEVMPEIAKSKLNVELGELNTKSAKAAALPALSLNASIGTGHMSHSDYSLSGQLTRGLTERVGLNLNIPILNQKQVKSSVNKARLQEETAKIENDVSEKNLLKTIESLYQNALSAQSRYMAATEKEKATSESYRLVSEQFTLGMRNTVDLLTEKNNYLNASQEVTQAKFSAVLAIKLLDFYQNIPIQL